MRIIITIPTIIFCLFAFIPAASIAQAADINDEGEAKLKTAFTHMLERQILTLDMDGEMNFDLQGELSVEQADSYYAITFPHITTHFKDGSSMEFGILSANAAPHDTPGQWKMTFAIPTPIRFFAANGAEAASINIEGQQAAGIFHDKFMQFSKLDAKYTGMNVVGEKSKDGLDIGDLIVRFDFDEDAQGRWSGPGYFELNTLSTENKRTAATIGQVKASFNMDQYNPQAGVDYQNRFFALKEKGAFNKPQMGDAEAQELASALLDLYTKGMNGFDMTYSLSDLNFKQATMDGEPEEFKLANASFGMNMDGFFTDLATFGFDLGYDGVSLSSMPVEKQDILPSSAKFGFQMQKIPFADLVSSVQNAMAGANNNMQIAAFGLMVKVPALLSQAGTKVEIKDNFLGNDLYRATLNGEIIADIAAANSATGQGRLDFKGLDALLGKVQAYSSAPDIKPKDAQNLMQMNGALQMLKAMGKPEGDSYIFDFVMDAQGQMLLNGQDIRTLGASAGAPVMPLPQ